MDFDSDESWKTFLPDDDHICTCEFCENHLLKAMYKRYRICEKWQAALKRWSCTNIILVNARKLSLEHPVNYEEVRSWGESFAKLIDHPVGRQLFKEYLTVEHSDENIHFWECVEVFKCLKTEDELYDVAQDMYEQFISSNSKTEVSLDSKCRVNIREHLKNPTPQLFNEAQQQCAKLMERDSYNRFTRSLLYRKFLQQQISVDVVESWADKFDYLLQHEVGRQMFSEFLQTEKADENIRFWEAVQEYKKTLPTDSTQLVKEAKKIYDEFVSSESTTEISLDSKIRSQITHDINNPTDKLFNEAENHIFLLMARDPYHRFVRSNMYKSYLEECIKIKSQVDMVDG